MTLRHDSTLRETSDRLLPLVSRLREEAENLDGRDIDRNRAAADLRHIAYELELRARKMATRGAALGEPEPS